MTSTGTQTRCPNVPSRPPIADTFPRCLATHAQCRIASSELARGPAAQLVAWRPREQRHEKGHLAEDGRDVLPLPCTDRGDCAAAERAAGGEPVRTAVPVVVR